MRRCAARAVTGGHLIGAALDEALHPGLGLRGYQRPHLGALLVPGAHLQPSSPTKRKIRLCIYKSPKRMRAVGCDAHESIKDIEHDAHIAGATKPTLITFNHLTCDW